MKQGTSITKLLFPLALAVLASGCGAMMEAPIKPDGVIKQENNHFRVDVRYGTNRKRVAGSEGKAADYLDDRGEMEFGVKTVSIPLNRIVGSMPQRDWSNFWRPDFCFFNIVDGKIFKNEDAFVGDLRELLAKNDGVNLFVYVHGFNNTFEEAILRGAQLTFDLSTKELVLAPVVFSWPSGKTTWGFDVVDDYMRAWTNREWAKKDLAEFLLLMAKEAKADNVFILAHSLGAGLLSGALEQIRLVDGDAKEIFKHILLAGADIDTATFKSVIAPRFAELAGQTTIYSTDNDTPLKISRKIHAGYPRLGDSSDKSKVAVVDGMDTVDVLGVDLSLLGHSYYAEMEATILDMNGAMRGQNSNNRQYDNDRKYWKLDSTKSEGRRTDQVERPKTGSDC